MWRIAAQGGPTLPLNQRGWTAQQAPHTQTLYYTRPDTSGLWALDQTTDTSSYVLPLAYVDRLNWIAQDEGIYFIHRCSPDALAFFDFETQSITPIAPLPKWLQTNASVSVAPGGSRILYTLTEAVQGDIMLVENIP